MRRPCPVPVLPSPSQLGLCVSLSTETGSESCFDEGNSGVPRVSMQTNGEFPDFLKGELLLPGIPNEITLNEICPNLPWSALNSLVSVSRGWKHAIRRRMVYDARHRHASKEKLVVIGGYRVAGREVHAIGLYSARDKLFHRLPPMPDLKTGVLRAWQCAAVDGKIYVLGLMGHNTLKPTGEVYVLDLAGGLRQWEQCASLTFPREKFGVGFVRGKLYVFGGTFDGHEVPVSEVYNPELDRWDLIDPKTCLPFYHGFTLYGKEVFIRRRVLGPLRFGNLEFDYDDNDAHECEPKILRPLFLDSCPPGKIENFERYCCQYKNAFVAQGKLHSMHESHIDVYDSDRMSWTARHSFSLSGIWRAIGLISRSPGGIGSWTFVVVDNELISLLRWGSRGRHFGEATLLQSVGFGGKNETIFWKKMESYYDLGVPAYCAPSVCAIQI